MEPQRESYSVGNPRVAHSMQAATMREAQVCCIVQGSKEKGAMVQDVWGCCSSAEVKEGALISSS